MQVTEIEAKSVLHYHKTEFATNWDLNIYRGCQHQCAYCFARYTHKYIDSKQFFNDIQVKTNSHIILDKEMGARKWQGDAITVCGVSDCYQPLESKYKLMPKILSTFMKYKNPIVIITKSNLILRDIEQIKALSEVADVIVCVSLMTLNENKIRAVEKFAPTAKARLEIFERLKDTKVKTTLIAAPIIPFITDTPEEIDDLFRAAAYYKIGRVQSWTMHLRGCNKGDFLQAVGGLVNWQQFNNMYNGIYVNKDYNLYIRNIVKGLRTKYNLWGNTDYVVQKANKEPKQISLFD